MDNQRVQFFKGLAALSFTLMLCVWGALAILSVSGPEKAILATFGAILAGFPSVFLHIALRDLAARHDPPPPAPPEHLILPDGTEVPRDELDAA